MLNNSVIGSLSDGYLQPMNDWILGSVLGRPSSSLNTADKFEFMLNHPIGSYIPSGLWGVLPIRWVSAACCPDLTRLDLTSNVLSIVYLSGSTALTILTIINSPYLKRLDVSTNTAISYFGCYNNSLKTLILPPSKASYSSFYCNDNQLTSLDLSGSISANIIDCYNNQLTSLNVTGSSVVQLQCQNNKLPSLNTVGCTSMQYLDCSNNELTSLTGSETLQYLNCSSNKLTSLDVKSLCTTLTELNCSYNIVGSLDVNTNSNLTSLNCYSNSLSPSSVVDNILITLNNNGNTNGTVNISGSGNSITGSAANGATTSLIGRGWTIYANNP